MPGAGTSTQNQNTNQATQSSSQNTSSNQGATASTSAQSSGPWAAAQPLIGNILSSLQGLSTTPSTAQSDAVANLQAGASAIPNEGAAASGVVGGLMDATPQYTGLLSGGLTDYQSSLAPYLSASYLNPMTTPGLSTALNTTNQNITNQINDQFAAAGRDLSPANTQALALGLSQGEAPLITNQYNQNVATQLGAANSLFGAAGTTASGLSGLDQTALANQEAGVNLAASLPGLYTAPGTAAVNAANTAYGLPFTNIGMLSQLALPIAGLGQTSSGSTSGTSSNAASSNASSTGATDTVGDTSSTLSPIGMLSALFGSGGSTGAGSTIGGLSNALGKGIGLLSGLF